MRDIRIAAVEVPAGTPVFVWTRVFAMREENFLEPEPWKHDRWLVGDDPAARAHLGRASIPFGAGPRVCPGRQLALLECSLLVSALVKNFELALPPGLEVRELFDFAMEPEGLRVIVRAR